MSFNLRTPQKGSIQQQSPSRGQRSASNREQILASRNLPSTNPVRAPTPDVLLQSERIGQTQMPEIQFLKQQQQSDKREMSISPQRKSTDISDKMQKIINEKNKEIELLRRRIEDLEQQIISGINAEENKSAQRKNESLQYEVQHLKNQLALKQNDSLRPRESSQEKSLQARDQLMLQQIQEENYKLKQQLQDQQQSTSQFQSPVKKDSNLLQQSLELRSSHQSLQKEIQKQKEQTLLIEKQNRLEIEQLHVLLKEKDDEIESWKSKYIEQIQSNKQKEQTEKTAKLVMEVNKLQQQLSLQQQQEQSLTDQIEIQKVSMEDQKKDIEQLVHQIQDQNATIQNLQNDKGQLNIINQDMLEKLQEKQSECNNLNEQLSNLQRLCQQQSEQSLQSIQAEQQKQETLHQQLENLSSQKALLEKQLQQSEFEKEQILATQQNQLQEMEKMKLELNSQSKERANALLRSSNTFQSSLKEKVNTLTTDNEQLQRDLSERAGQIAELQARLLATQDEAALAKQQKQRLEQQCVQSATQLASKENALEQQKRVSASKDQEIQELKQQLLGIVQEFDRSQWQEASGLEQRVKEAEQKLQQSAVHLQESKESCSEALVRVVLQLVQLRSQHEMIAALNREIEEKMEVAAQREYQMGLMLQEAQNQQEEQIEKLRKETMELREEIDRKKVQAVQREQEFQRQMELVQKEFRDSQLMHQGVLQEKEKQAEARELQLQSLMSQLKQQQQLNNDFGEQQQYNRQFPQQGELLTRVVLLNSQIDLLHKQLEMAREQAREECSKEMEDIKQERERLKRAAREREELDEQKAKEMKKSVQLLQQQQQQVQQGSNEKQATAAVVVEDLLKKLAEVQAENETQREQIKRQKRRAEEVENNLQQKAQQMAEIANQEQQQQLSEAIKDREKLKRALREREEIDEQRELEMQKIVHDQQEKIAAIFQGQNQVEDAKQQQMQQQAALQELMNQLALVQAENLSQKEMIKRQKRRAEELEKESQNLKQELSQQQQQKQDENKAQEVEDVAFNMECIQDGGQLDENGNQQVMQEGVEDPALQQEGQQQQQQQDQSQPKKNTVSMQQSLNRQKTSPSKKDGKSAQTFSGAKRIQPGAGDNDAAYQNDLQQNDQQPVENEEEIDNYDIGNINVQQQDPNIQNDEGGVQGGEPQSTNNLDLQKQQSQPFGKPQDDQNLLQTQIQQLLKQQIELCDQSQKKDQKLEQQEREILLMTGTIRQLIQKSMGKDFQLEQNSIELQKQQSQLVHLLNQRQNEFSQQQQQNSSNQPEFEALAKIVLLSSQVKMQQSVQKDLVVAVRGREGQIKEKELEVMGLQRDLQRVSLELNTQKQRQNNSALLLRRSQQVQQQQQNYPQQQEETITQLRQDLERCRELLKWEQSALEKQAELEGLRKRAAELEEQQKVNQDKFKEQETLLQSLSMSSNRLRIDNEALRKNLQEERAKNSNNLSPDSSNKQSFISIGSSSKGEKINRGDDNNANNSAAEVKALREELEYWKLKNWQEQELRENNLIAQDEAEEIKVLFLELQQENDLLKREVEQLREMTRLVSMEKTAAESKSNQAEITIDVLKNQVILLETKLKQQQLLQQQQSSQSSADKDHQRSSSSSSSHQNISNLEQQQQRQNLLKFYDERHEQMVAELEKTAAQNKDLTMQAEEARQQNRVTTAKSEELLRNYQALQRELQKTQQSLLQQQQLQLQQTSQVSAEVESLGERIKRSLIMQLSGSCNNQLLSGNVVFNNNDNLQVPVVSQQQQQMSSNNNQNNNNRSNAGSNRQSRIVFDQEREERHLQTARELDKCKKEIDALKAEKAQLEMLAKNAVEQAQKSANLEDIAREEQLRTKGLEADILSLQNVISEKNKMLAISEERVAALEKHANRLQGFQEVVLRSSNTLQQQQQQGMMGKDPKNDQNSTAAGQLAVIRPDQILLENQVGKLQNELLQAREAWEEERVENAFKTQEIQRMNADAEQWRLLYSQCLKERNQLEAELDQCDFSSEDYDDDYCSVQQQLQGKTSDQGSTIIVQQNFQEEGKSSLKRGSGVVLAAKRRKRGNYNRHKQQQQKADQQQTEYEKYDVDELLDRTQLLEREISRLRGDNEALILQNKGLQTMEQQNAEQRERLTQLEIQLRQAVRKSQLAELLQFQQQLQQDQDQQQNKNWNSMEEMCKHFQEKMLMMRQLLEEEKQQKEQIKVQTKQLEEDARRAEGQRAVLSQQVSALTAQNDSLRKDQLLLLLQQQQQQGQTTEQTPPEPDKNSEKEQEQQAKFSAQQQKIEALVQAVAEMETATKQSERALAAKDVELAAIKTELEAQRELAEKANILLLRMDNNNNYNAQNKELKAVDVELQKNLDECRGRLRDVCEENQALVQRQAELRTQQRREAEMFKELAAKDRQIAVLKQEIQLLEAQQQAMMNDKNKKINKLRQYNNKSLYLSTSQGGIMKQSPQLLQQQQQLLNEDQVQNQQMENLPSLIEESVQEAIKSRSELALKASQDAISWREQCQASQKEAERLKAVAQEAGDRAERLEQAQKAAKEISESGVFKAEQDEGRKQLLLLKIAELEAAQITLRDQEADAKNLRLRIRDLQEQRETAAMEAEHWKRGAESSNEKALQAEKTALELRKTLEQLREELREANLQARNQAQEFSENAQQQPRIVLDSVQQPSQPESAQVSQQVIETLNQRALSLQLALQQSEGRVQQYTTESENYRVQLQKAESQNTLLQQENELVRLRLLEKEKNAPMNVRQSVLNMYDEQNNRMRAEVTRLSARVAEAEGRTQKLVLQLEKRDREIRELQEALQVELELQQQQQPYLSSMAVLPSKSERGSMMQIQDEQFEEEPAAASINNNNLLQNQSSKDNQQQQSLNVYGNLARQSQIMRQQKRRSYISKSVKWNDMLPLQQQRDSLSHQQQQLLLLDNEQKQQQQQSLLTDDSCRKEINDLKNDLAACEQVIASKNEVVRRLEEQAAELNNKLRSAQNLQLGLRKSFASCKQQRGGAVQEQDDEEQQETNQRLLLLAECQKELQQTKWQLEDARLDIQFKDGEVRRMIQDSQTWQNMYEQSCKEMTQKIVDLQQQLKQQSQQSTDDDRQNQQQQQILQGREDLFLELEKQRIRAVNAEDEKSQLKNKTKEQEERIALLQMEMNRLRGDNDFLMAQNKNLSILEEQLLQEKLNSETQNLIIQNQVQGNGCNTVTAQAVDMLKKSGVIMNSQQKIQQQVNAKIVPDQQQLQIEDLNNQKQQLSQQVQQLYTENAQIQGLLQEAFSALKNKQDELDIEKVKRTSSSSKQSTENNNNREELLKLYDQQVARLREENQKLAKDLAEISGKLEQTQSELALKKSELGAQQTQNTNLLQKIIEQEQKNIPQINSRSRVMETSIAQQQLQQQQQGGENQQQYQIINDQVEVNELRLRVASLLQDEQRLQLNLAMQDELLKQARENQENAKKQAQNARSESAYQQNLAAELQSRLYNAELQLIDLKSQIELLQMKSSNQEQQKGSSIVGESGSNNNNPQQPLMEMYEDQMNFLREQNNAFNKALCEHSILVEQQKCEIQRLISQQQLLKDENERFKQQASQFSKVAAQTARLATSGLAASTLRQSLMMAGVNTNDPQIQQLIQPNTTNTLQQPQQQQQPGLSFSFGQDIADLQMKVSQGLIPLMSSNKNIVGQQQGDNQIVSSGNNLNQQQSQQQQRLILNVVQENEQLRVEAQVHRHQAEKESYDQEKKTAELERQIQSLKSDLASLQEVIDTKNTIISQNCEAIERQNADILRMKQRLNNSTFNKQKQQQQKQQSEMIDGENDTNQQQQLMEYEQKIADYKKQLQQLQWELNDIKTQSYFKDQEIIKLNNEAEQWRELCQKDEKTCLNLQKQVLEAQIQIRRSNFQQQQQPKQDQPLPLLFVPQHQQQQRGSNNNNNDNTANNNNKEPEIKIANIDDQQPEKTSPSIIAILANKDLEDLRIEVARLRADNACLQSESKERVECELQLANQNTRINELESELRKAQRSSKFLSQAEELEMLRSELEQSKNLVDWAQQSEKYVQGLEKQLEEKQGEIDALNQTLTEKINQVLDLDTKKTVTVNQLRAMKEENDILRARLIQMENNNVGLQSTSLETMMLDAQLKKLTQDNDFLSTSRAEKMAEIEKLQRILDLKTSEIIVQKSENERLKQQLMRTSDQSSLGKKDFGGDEMLKKQLEESKYQQQNMKLENDILQNQLKSMEKQKVAFVETMNHVKELERALQQTKAESAVQQQTITQLLNNEQERALLQLQRDQSENLLIQQQQQQQQQQLKQSAVQSDVEELLKLRSEVKRARWEADQACADSLKRIDELRVVRGEAEQWREKYAEEARKLKNLLLQQQQQEAVAADQQQQQQQEKLKEDKQEEESDNKQNNELYDLATINQAQDKIEIEQLKVKLIDCHGQIFQKQSKIDQLERKSDALNLENNRLKKDNLVLDEQNQQMKLKQNQLLRKSFQVSDQELLEKAAAKKSQLILQVPSLKQSAVGEEQQGKESSPQKQQQSAATTGHVENLKKELDCLTNDYNNAVNENADLQLKVALLSSEIDKQHLLNQMQLMQLNELQSNKNKDDKSSNSNNKDQEITSWQNLGETLQEKKLDALREEKDQLNSQLIEQKKQLELLKVQASQYKSDAESLNLYKNMHNLLKNENEDLKKQLLKAQQPQPQQQYQQEKQQQQQQTIPVLKQSIRESLLNMKRSSAAGEQQKQSTFLKQSGQLLKSQYNQQKQATLQSAENADQENSSKLIQELQLKCNLLQSEKDDLQNTIQQLQAEILEQSAQETLKLDQERKINELRADIEHYRNGIEQLKVIQQQKEENISSLKKQLQELRGLHQGISKSQLINKQNAQLQNSASADSQQLQQQQQQPSTPSNKKTKLLGEGQEQVEQISALKNQMQSKQWELDDCKMEMQLQEQRTATIGEEAEMWRNKYMEAQQEISDELNRKKLGEAAQQIMQKEKDICQANIMEKDRALQEWQARYALLMSQSQQDQREKLLLQDKNKFLNEKNNNLETQLQKERALLEKVMRTSASFSPFKQIQPYQQQFQQFQQGENDLQVGEDSMGQNIIDINPEKHLQSQRFMNEIEALKLEKERAEKDAQSQLQMVEESNRQKLLEKDLSIVGLQNEIENFQKRVQALEQANKRDLDDISDLASAVQKNAVDRAVKDATVQLNAENTNLNKHVNMLIQQTEQLKNNNTDLREQLMQKQMENDKLQVIAAAVKISPTKQSPLKSKAVQQQQLQQKLSPTKGDVFDMQVEDDDQLFLKELNSMSKEQLVQLCKDQDQQLVFKDVEIQKLTDSVNDKIAMLIEQQNSSQTQNQEKDLEDHQMKQHNQELMTELDIKDEQLLDTQQQNEQLLEQLNQKINENQELANQLFQQENKAQQRQIEAETWALKYNNLLQQQMQLNPTTTENESASNNLIDGSNRNSDVSGKKKNNTGGGSTPMKLQLNQKVAELTQQVAQMQNENAVLRMQEQTQQEKYGSLVQQLENQKKYLMNKSQLNQDSEYQQKKLSLENEDLKEKVATLNAELANLEEQNFQFLAEIERLNAVLKQLLEEKPENLIQNSESQQAELQNLRIMLQMKIAEIEQLQQQIQKLRQDYSKIGELQGRIGLIQADSVRFEKENDFLQNQTKQLQQKNAETELRVQDLEREVNDLKLELNAKKQEIQLKERFCDQWKAKCDELLTQQQEIVQQSSMCDLKSTMREEEIELMQKQMQEMKWQIEEMQNKIKNQDRVLDLKEQEIQVLKKKDIASQKSVLSNTPRQGNTPRIGASPKYGYSPKLGAATPNKYGSPQSHSRQMSQGQLLQIQNDPVLGKSQFNNRAKSPSLFAKPQHQPQQSDDQSSYQKFFTEEDEALNAPEQVKALKKKLDDKEVLLNKLYMDNQKLSQQNKDLLQKQSPEGQQIQINGYKAEIELHKKAYSDKVNELEQLFKSSKQKENNLEEEIADLKNQLKQYQRGVEAWQKGPDFEEGKQVQPVLNESQQQQLLQDFAQIKLQNADLVQKLKDAQAAEKQTELENNLLKNDKTDLEGQLNLWKNKYAEKEKQIEILENEDDEDQDIGQFQLDDAELQIGDQQAQQQKQEVRFGQDDVILDDNNNLSNQQPQQQQQQSSSDPDKQQQQQDQNQLLSPQREYQPQQQQGSVHRKSPSNLSNQKGGSLYASPKLRTMTVSSRGSGSLSRKGIKYDKSVHDEKKLLNDEIERLLKINKEKEQRLQEQQQKINNYDEFKEKLNKLENQRVEELQEMRQTLDSLRNLHVVPNNEEQEAERQLYQNTISQLKNKVSDLEASLKEKIFENNNLKSAVAEKAKEISELQNLMADSPEGSLEQLQRQIIEYKDRIDELENDKNRQEAKIKQQQLKLQAIEKELEEAYQECDNRKNERDEALNSVDELKKERQQFIKDKINLVKNVSIDFEKLKLLQQDLEDLNDQKQVYKQQALQHAKELNNKNGELVEKLNELENLKEQYNMSLNNMQNYLAQLLAKLQQQEIIIA